SRHFNEDEKGNKKYGGNELVELISLDLGRTLEVLGYVYELINTEEGGYIIPISDEMLLYSGGLLKGGRFMQLKNEHVLGPGATTLFLVPR
ncbi:hypothetical protein N7451_002506, partial [Penicillium sp. IBT 35674x]